VEDGASLFHSIANLTGRVGAEMYLFNACIRSIQVDGSGKNGRLSCGKQPLISILYRGQFSGAIWYALAFTYQDIVSLS
jgi:hypothetical protein